MSLSLDDPLIQDFIQTHNGQAGQTRGEDWDFRSSTLVKPISIKFHIRLFVKPDKVASWEN